LTAVAVPSEWLFLNAKKFELSAAAHSPFATAVLRSQSGTKLPVRGSPGPNVLSLHARFVVCANVDALLALM
jgi:hypothetical protein